MKRVVLIGNPNTGKSSLFNQLTGLHQKTGNFSGVTVEIKKGHITGLDQKIEIVDLPGTYSLYPKSEDEKIVLEALLNPDHLAHPDLVVLVADASNIKRNLLLYTGIVDLGYNCIVVLNMADIAQESGRHINVEALQEKLPVSVIMTNAKQGKGIQQLKNEIRLQLSRNKFLAVNDFSFKEHHHLLDTIQKEFHLKNRYWAFVYLCLGDTLDFLSKENRDLFRKTIGEGTLDVLQLQAEETLRRYARINDIIKSVSSAAPEKRKHTFRRQIDNILLHPVGGYLIFFALLFLIFQAIFAWASYPMDWIDVGFSQINEYLKALLPPGKLTLLLTDGLIAGLSGVLIFIPQIAILFVLISILEESGYMARVMVLMDRLMRRFGLSGKSVIPLISGMACAIPAIMAARSIHNKRERLITIFVTPLMSCSARLPIYTIIIALVIPDRYVFGVLNLQGLALLAMYALGFVMAVLSAWLMKQFIKVKERSYFIIELPLYKVPRWRNIALTVFKKTSAFVWGAGKIIIAISIVLWVMASYGPGDDMQQAEMKTRKAYGHVENQKNLNDLIAAKQLEVSYIGVLGKFIEPAIKPLGYDWKIGIALITSFAAREVFVGSVATIYSIGAEADERTIKDKMKKEINPDTGEKVFNLATGISLLLFYAFAMQCMSTFAVVVKETGSWKWATIQLLYMSMLAYFAAFLAYNFLK